MHQEIVLGGAGQAFFVEPIERPRRPASVVVKTATGIVQAAATSCDIDPVETTLAEAAPAGTTMLRLKDTAGITAGTRYVIARHGVVVTAVGEGFVRLRRPLALALAASETFLGCRISAPVEPAWSAAVANVTEHLDVEAGYTLVWTYHTQAGGTTTAKTTADLVRTPQLARVTADDVDGRFPGWREMVEHPEDVIAEAFDIVRRDARLHHSIRRARHAFALRELTMLAANVIAIEQAVLFRGGSHKTLEAAEARYHATMQELARRASAPPPQPVPSWKRVAPLEEPALDVSHASVIDALLEWIATHPLHVEKNVHELRRVWLPLLKTRDARLAAARALRSKKGTRRNWALDQVILGLEQ